MKPYHPLRFFLVFACCLLAGFFVLFTEPAQSIDRTFSQQLVGISQTVVQACGGHAAREAAIMRAPGGFGVEMREGCNAVNVTILFWSAILAFPTNWKMKLIGLLAGSSIIQSLNILRFISLFYLGQYSMNWFEFAHSYLWESLLVLDTMVIFWLWVNRVARPGAAVHAGN